MNNIVKITDYRFDRERKRILSKLNDNDYKTSILNEEKEIKAKLLELKEREGEFFTNIFYYVLKCYQREYLCGGFGGGSGFTFKINFFDDETLKIEDIKSFFEDINKRLPLDHYLPYYKENPPFVYECFLECLNGDELDVYKFEHLVIKRLIEKYFELSHTSLKEFLSNNEGSPYLDPMYY